MIRSNRFGVPPVVLNLLIINILVYMAQSMIPQADNWIIENLALFPPQSPFFRLYQSVTYMFLHGNLSHLFFNMFALYMFGCQGEYDLGSKRFLTYYMICGIGAGLLNMGVSWMDIAGTDLSAMTPTEAAYRINVPTVGASGAVFGILLSFGLMHPDARIMMLFFPVPVKAKYFVIGYGVLELLLGISGHSANIAHFAHVGGMLFGLLMLRLWKKQGKIYY